MTYSMLPTHSQAWNPISPKNFFVPFFEMRSWHKSSINFLVIVNEIYITHEPIVHTQRRWTFECLYFPVTPTCYWLFSNKWQSWHKWYNFNISPLTKYFIYWIILGQTFNPFSFFLQAHYFAISSLMICSNSTMIQHFIFRLQHHKQLWCTVYFVHVQFLISIRIIAQLGCYDRIHDSFLCCREVP